MNTTNPFLKITRNSRMQIEEVYFWTSTIKDWKKLLKQDKYKVVIINSLKELADRKLIKVYAFVIMPNHIHLVWEMLDKNGKEMPHASFNKKTAHEIVKDLKLYHPVVLSIFKVNEKEREYRIWQRDPLAIEMIGKNNVEQKINYLHNNPLHERWNLADKPENYYWSSANYYQTGEDRFDLLTHYMERF